MGGGPFRVVHVESPSSGAQGDNVYRTTQPCDALGGLPGVEVISGSFNSSLVTAEAEHADAVVLCDVIDVDALALIDRRRAAGLTTVYELNDDVRCPQPWSATAYLAKNLVTRSLSSQLAARSDGLQLSTPELERRYGFLHARRHVFPNQLARVPSPPKPRDGLVLGWGGSEGHFRDVEAVMPVVARVLAARPALTFSLMGAEVFRPLVASLPRATFRPGGSLSDYYGFLESLSLGLAPNLPTDFNRCRSDVKYLEYAAHGVVAICQDIEPYQGSVRTGETGVRYRTLEELEAWLLRLCDSESLRTSLTHRAYDEVASSRIEALGAQQRLQWLAPRWQALTHDSGGHVRLTSAAEPELLEGLMALRDGASASAERAFRDASAREPSFHLPALYLGQTLASSAEAHRSLERAFALAPTSASVALVRADRYADEGALEQARAWYERAHALSPHLGVPLFRLGALAERRGDVAAAAELFEAALVANPYFVAPAAHRALKALEVGSVDEAIRFAERALASDDSAWLLHFVLGRAHLAKGQASAAVRHLRRALEGGGEAAPITALLAKAWLLSGDVDQARSLVKTLAA